MRYHGMKRLLVAAGLALGLIVAVTGLKAGPAHALGLKAPVFTAPLALKAPPLTTPMTLKAPPFTLALGLKAPPLT